MFLLLACLTALSGCSSYQLRGVVIEGAMPRVEVVSASDARLKQGMLVADAAVEVVVDPNDMRPVRLAPIASDLDGSFSLPVDVTGAGLLEYEIRVVATKPGYQTAVATLPMPGSGSRLLITLTPGRDSYRPSTDILRETQQAGEALGR